MALIDVPLAAQTLAATQNPIRQNFLTINNVFGVDHVVYGIVDAGKHNHVTFPRQAGDPAVVGTEVALYTKLSGLTALSEIFFNRPSDGSLVPVTASNFAIAGYAYLPSGILLKWAQVTAPALNSTYVYPAGAGFPAFVNQLVVIASARTPGEDVYPGVFTNPLQFTYTSTAVGVQFTFLAIGY